MIRPRLNDNSPTVRLDLKLPAADREAIRRAAKAAGLSVNEFVRTAALTAAAKLSKGKGNAR